MSIHQEALIAAPPQRVYQLLTSGDLFSAATGMPAEITDREGDAFSIFGGRVEGRQIELVPDQRVVQAWRFGAAHPSPWESGVYSTVRFALERTEDGTRLVIDHTGIPKEWIEHISSGYPTLYQDPLMKFFQERIGSGIHGSLSTEDFNRAADHVEGETSTAISVARAHIDAWSHHDWDRTRELLAPDVHALVTSTQATFGTAELTGVDAYMEPKIRAAQLIEPGSVREIAAIGDERNAHVLITFRIDLGPGGTMVTMARSCLYLVDEDARIKEERDAWCILPSRVH
jgi:uncharacterized protein YndB with AHSA1/START domain